MDRSVSDSADATPSPTPRDARSNTPGRKYGFSCSACRRRKVRCDAHKPTCRGCVRLGEACVYPTASNASVARLTSALERSEARVATLQETLSRQGQPEAARTAEEPGEPGEPGEPREPGQVDTHAETQPASAADKGLVLDEHGTVQYYGATSRFHLALPPQAGPGGLGGVPPVPPPDEAYHRRWLLSNARFQAVWDRAVLANLRALTHDVIRAETGGAVLLDIFWTWQAPLHNYMYRRTFTRDMALGGEGPYFSALLLNVILAHACRHVPADDATFAPYEKGDVFLRRAKMLLMEDLEHDKPRIPTIQALLLLGGRQCAVGRNAQGWLYTGMAIRMLKHLGWHLPKAEAVPQSYQGQHGQQGQHGHGQHCVSLLERLEPDDLEARKRLCLSAYVWDK
ncbi:hypothetical protein SCUCBS95973_002863 [Sporothrix curviconia]|uniref:Zn(2)-C6 fungal-type domain-containing protein n=1 Tax=Sporothrix curviconia TaxID=1260050 RepID=A0ABP0BAK7_9PEZI